MEIVPCVVSLWVNCLSRTCLQPFWILLLSINSLSLLHKLLETFHSFIQAISMVPLQVHYYSEALPAQHGYCVVVSCRSATGNCKWKTCPRSLYGGQSKIRSHDPLGARWQIYLDETPRHTFFGCVSIQETCILYLMFIRLHYWMWLVGSSALSKCICGWSYWLFTEHVLCSTTIFIQCLMRNNYMQV